MSAPEYFSRYDNLHMSRDAAAVREFDIRQGASLAQP